MSLKIIPAEIVHMAFIAVTNAKDSSIEPVMQQLIEELDVDNVNIGKMAAHIEKQLNFEILVESFRKVLQVHFERVKMNLFELLNTFEEFLDFHRFLLSDQGLRV